MGKNEILIICVIGAIFAFVVAFFAVSGLRRWLGNRLLDIPNERSSHFHPVPRGGGLAIVVVTLTGSWLVLPFLRPEVTAWQWLAFSVGALLIAGVSWLDDLRSLSTRVRFAVHLAGAVLAVLAFGAWKELSWPPAKIFMGDVGSAFLGYSFAVLPVIAASADPRFVITGVLLVWPFVFDTVFTFSRRLIKRENVFTAHRSHLYQRLVISGLSHQTVTLLYIALALLGAISAVALVLD